jgi:acid phosphatase (class A)
MEFRQMKRSLAPLLLAVAALALSAAGEPPKGYLPAGAHPDGQKILPAPPEVGSPAWTSELARFEATRALEGTPRWAQAIRDTDIYGQEPFRGFSCAAGVKLGPDTTPVLASMLLRLIHDARPLYNPPKDFYARKRPAVGNTAPICVPREPWIETNGSYPSGHAMLGYSWSLILAELVPDRATELVIRGRDFGDSRAICGVHWQSDVEAGRTLAAALVARLHADPGFMSDMATAKAEVEAARKLGAPEGCSGA